MIYFEFDSRLRLIIPKSGDIICWAKISMPNKRVKVVREWYRYQIHPGGWPSPIEFTREVKKWMKDNKLKYPFNKATKIFFALTFD